MNICNIQLIKRFVNRLFQIFRYLKYQTTLFVNNNVKSIVKNRGWDINVLESRKKDDFHN